MTCALLIRGGPVIDGTSAAPILRHDEATGARPGRLVRA